MTKSLLRKSMLPAVALAAILNTLTPIHAAQPKVGDEFPALQQFKLEGPVPESLKGKVVLLDFWASWCSPCKASFPALNELQEKYGARGFAVVAVNVDEQRGDMEKFLKKNNATFTIVRDAAQKLVAAASVETMPTSFLLDAEGRVRFIHSGFHGDQTKAKYVSEIESLLTTKSASR